LFRALVGIRRSRICAEHAEEHGRTSDAESYRAALAANQTLLDSHIE
jgi:hypothetical protein